MNVARKVFAILAALAFAALAVPAAAQNVKYFTLGAPTTATVATTSIQVTFKNIETGNSSFNSIGIKGIASGGSTVSITGATASPGRTPNFSLASFSSAAPMSIYISFF